MYNLVSNRSAWQFIIAIALSLVFILMTVLTNNSGELGQGTDRSAAAITAPPDQSRASNLPYKTGGNTLTGESIVTEGGTIPGYTSVYHSSHQPSAPKPCGAASGAAANQSSPVGGADHTRDPRDMKILVIASDGKESDYLALIATLDRLGVPYDVLIATEMTLTSNLLWDGVSHGCYQGIMLTTSILTFYNSTTQDWESAFSSDEWQALWQYEAMFGVRQITSYTYPGWPQSFGLHYVSYQDTGVAPLQVNLTSAGQQIFPYLHTGNPILIKNARVYLATSVLSETANMTPLLTAPNPNGAPYIVAAIEHYNDGRENLAVLAENNPNLLHTLLLSYGLVNWLTDGLFLGERHVTMDVQPDDVFISNMMWDPTALLDTTGRTFRMNSDDLTALINWQNDMRTRFLVAADLKLEMPFVGAGGAGLYSPDSLTPALIANQASFNWINHTFHHRNLNNITAAEATTELQLNDDFARRSGFSSYSKDAMIQPDISGLYNAAFKQAAYDFGIRYLISDTSQSGWSNPSPNTGFFNPDLPGLIIIPRHATSLFYNVRTPDEWVSEYNCYYGPQGACADGARRYWDHNLTYAEILDRESDRWLQYLLKWDIDPMMFHQPNLGAYDGVHSLLGDLIEATLNKYSSMYTLPIQNLTQHEVGGRMANRMAYNTSGIVATLYPGRSITLTTLNSAVIPVTGVTYGDNHEMYGGQSISYIRMDANQSLSVPLTLTLP